MLELTVDFYFWSEECVTGERDEAQAVGSRLENILCNKELKRDHT